MAVALGKTLHGGTQGTPAQIAYQQKHEQLREGMDQFPEVI